MDDAFAGGLVELPRGVACEFTGNNRIAGGNGRARLADERLATRLPGKVAQPPCARTYNVFFRRLDVRQLILPPGGQAIITYPPRALQVLGAAQEGAGIHLSGGGRPTF